nr:brain injury-derived neurotropic peptide [Rattus norvegicus]
EALELARGAIFQA